MRTSSSNRLAFIYINYSSIFVICQGILYIIKTLQKLSIKICDSQNTFLRDMKPQFGLFVLSFYHILPRFSTKAAVNKPQQNRNLSHQNRNKPRISLSFRDIFAPFGSEMVGERLCLSKARSNFEAMWKKITFTKFLRVPVGADL